MKTPSKTTKSRIPAFANYAEEAEFWDTHDTADYEGEFRPVRVRFAKNLSEGITIRFDQETLSKLRAEARQKGMGPTTLARMWILERLQPNSESRKHGTRRKGNDAATS